MAKVYVIYWYDPYCPENVGQYIGIASTEEKAHELGKAYIKRSQPLGYRTSAADFEDYGRYSVRGIEMDTIRSF